ncbi:MAG: nucleotidyltransferase substrate binding protein [Halobacteriovoraceae bacterium]|nr:nucleotidyltransferase substrate binding protein [Halobacteriovoraceae bacterium]
MIDLSKLDNGLRDFGLALEGGKNILEEFTALYDLCLKMIQQYLEESSINPGEIELLEFNQIIRNAYAMAIISEELATWKSYQNYRDHIVSKRKTDEDSMKIMRGFLHEAGYLASQLKERVKNLE